MEYYEQLYDDELYHYGVKGMRWGVRRGLSELRKSSSSGDRDSHNHAVNKLRSHRDKINKKLTALESKSEKLETKRYKTTVKNEPKIAKYNKKAAKYRQKASISFLPIKERSLNIKASKLDVKVSKLERKATRIKVKIEKNERMKKAFETGLNDINKELIDNGRDFIYAKVKEA